VLARQKRSCHQSGHGIFENPLPGIPNIDSPFFEKFFDDPAIDPTIRVIAGDLRDKGYAVIDFPEPEIEAVAGRIIERLKPRYDWDRWRADPGSFNSRIPAVTSGRFIPMSISA
jgi:hypothetical protein